MFERFTDRARRVVVLAQEEARLLNHGYIGTEHILLGLVSEGDGVAARSLERLGVSLEAVRAKVEGIIGRGGGAPSGHIPFTPRAKKVLELSLRESLQLGHNYIGTEHILLGLIREGEGVAAQVLVSLGVDVSRVRQEVIQQLSGYRGGPPGTVHMHPTGGPRGRETPAAAKAGVEARRLAGGSSIGSQHFLVALLRQKDSMAAKALAALGVSPEAIEAKLAELDPTGTSDETPEEAGARRIAMRLEGPVLVVEIDDPQLAGPFLAAMAGRDSEILKGSDPEAAGAGFPNLWSAVLRTVEQLARAKRMTGRRAATPSPAPNWRPPALKEMAQAASYWVVNLADGPHCTLEVGGADRDRVRVWLLDWLVQRRASLVAPEGSVTLGAAALWVSVQVAGETFTVDTYGFGPAGPPGSEPVPLEFLVDVAIDDLMSET